MGTRVLAGMSLFTCFRVLMEIFLTAHVLGLFKCPDWSDDDRDNGEVSFDITDLSVSELFFVSVRFYPVNSRNKVAPGTFPRPRFPGIG